MFKHKLKKVVKKSCKCGWYYSQPLYIYNLLLYSFLYSNKSTHYGIVCDIVILTMRYNLTLYRHMQLYIYLRSHNTLWQTDMDQNRKSVFFLRLRYTFQKLYEMTVLISNFEFCICVSSVPNILKDVFCLTVAFCKFVNA